MEYTLLAEYDAEIKAVRAEITAKTAEFVESLEPLKEKRNALVDNRRKLNKTIQENELRSKQEVGQAHIPGLICKHKHPAYPDYVCDSKAYITGYCKYHDPAVVLCANEDCARWVTTEGDFCLSCKPDACQYRQCTRKRVEGGGRVCETHRDMFQSLLQ